MNGTDRRDSVSVAGVVVFLPIALDVMNGNNIKLISDLHPDAP